MKFSQGRELDNETDENTRAQIERSEVQCLAKREMEKENAKGKLF